MIVISVLGAREGVVKAANEWPEGTEFYLAGMDEQLDGKGYIVPGLGDVGDRCVSTFLLATEYGPRD